jgi:SAM-dependent methyltransferase
VLSSDIVACGWHDLAADAQRLPFPDGILDNIVGIDFLHHLNDPMRFLAEAGRALRPGGRLVMIEPWETPLSHFVNTCFKDEDWDLTWRPGDLYRPSAKAPMEANGAVPYVLFAKRRSSLPQLLPTLKLVQVEPFGFLGDLLSLGFRETSLLPLAWYPRVRAVETATRPIWRRLAALKALIVLVRI